MSHTPGTAAAENDGDFDPSQAAALLEQATGQARRTFMPFGPPLLWAFRAVIGLVAQRAKRAWVGVTVVALVAVAAGFGGPAGAWLIMGIGLAAVCLGIAGFIARQQRRSAVWS